MTTNELSEYCKINKIKSLDFDNNSLVLSTENGDIIYINQYASDTSYEWFIETEYEIKKQNELNEEKLRLEKIKYNQDKEKLFKELPPDKIERLFGDNSGYEAIF
jgi:hypothetical protein